MGCSDNRYMGRRGAKAPNLIHIVLLRGDFSMVIGWPMGGVVSIKFTSVSLRE